MIDVQLTKDNIPILYHDFNMTEHGLQIPVNSVTLSQFLATHPTHDPSHRQLPTSMRRGRSLENLSFSDEFENMKHSIKGNFSGTIQGPFATLEEALKGVPISTGFNIEVKYPNKEEAECENLCHPEINLFCDRILDIVFEFGNDRNIYFSSFHPEICLIMCKKQVYLFNLKLESLSCVFLDRRWNGESV
jgi:glycerophosphodiester phosphodiesterase